ncbi:MAG: hypothetical protein IKD94_03220 [Erysipelotrichaceae bacterium]|nr:hypothetical protein [Erysipelotrichaceae bacterium]
MRILHLYPNLMNLYGDYGNIKVLVDHLKDLGVDASIDCVELDYDYNVSDYDLIYMGPGSESRQLAALDDLMNHRDGLKEYLDNDKVLLFTGNAMELLGESIDDKKALGILDFKSRISDKRYTGDVIMNNDELGRIVGFINKSSLIEGGEEYKLFSYEFRDNNLVDNDYEGWRYHNGFGTHISGPILIKNPSFMDLMIKLLSGERYRKINYHYEDEAYRITLQELEKRK